MPNVITKKKVCEIIPKTMPLMVKSRITQRMTTPAVVTRVGHWRPEELIVQPSQGAADISNTYGNA